ncbi:hypothetical protein 162300116 [Organic Lake phycodnavirus 2]|nr:hypothetical protein 162300116 [Organic Lake phycodnavirus 2]
MNYYAVLKKHYDGKIWGIAEDYSTLDWGDETPKPTDEEMINHWNNMKHEYLEDSMRQQRNRLLQESDYRALPDYPQRDKWIVYRQELRDFPSIWTEGIEFPTSPE